MKLLINRDDLYEPLQAVCGVVERRQTLPILSNILLHIDKEHLKFITSDLEVETCYLLHQVSTEQTKTTIPARKFLDIIKSLPEGSDLELDIKDENILIKSGKSRFKLTTLPAEDYPVKDQHEINLSLQIKEKTLKQLFENTQFAMAHQDVRYYLNGLLLELDKDMIKTIATDGHRLAISEADSNTAVQNLIQVIIPRKGIQEMCRVLRDSEELVDLEIGTNYVRLVTQHQSLTTKLIDGKFPDYERVIPVDSNKKVYADRIKLKNCLARTSILSNEKFRGIRLHLQEGKITTTANNPEQEMAEEEIDVNYSGESMEIGFNVSYILDVLNIIRADQIMLELKDADSSCLITSPEYPGNRYVIMPMRL